jgi:IclR family acetate operon transcriptional repressor
MTDPDVFLAALHGVRASGYALDEGEQEVGVRCVAVAVPDTAIRLAVSVSGPAPRMTDELVAHAVPILRETTKRLAAELS